MATVHDVAAHVLERTGSMSAMKLQKLVYYSQAWATVLLGERLFQERVCAWAHGPVVHELFDLHRGQFVVGPGWPSGDSGRLSTAQRDLVDRVLGSYGKLSSEQLRELTHSEQPWKVARRDVPEGERWRAVIPWEEMRRFYSTQPMPRPAQ